MLYIILNVCLCLNFIIICYLLLFTIFLLQYQAGTSVIHDCLLNQRFVFLLAARTNYGKFNIHFKGLFFGKFFALTNLSVSLKSLLLIVILILIYTSSLLQSICSDIFSSLPCLFFSLLVYFIDSIFVPP